MAGNLEQRIEALETMISEIHTALNLGQGPVPPGEIEYRHVLKAMWEGNMAPLRLYLQRGGVIPKAETAYPHVKAKQNALEANTCAAGS